MKFEEEQRASNESGKVVGINTFLCEEEQRASNESGKVVGINTSDHHGICVTPHRQDGYHCSSHSTLDGFVVSAKTPRVTCLTVMLYTDNDLVINKNSHWCIECV